MMLRNPVLVLLVGASCVMAEPIGDEPATEGGAADSQDGDGSGDGHTGMSSNVDGTATATATTVEPGDDSATVSGTATSGSATDASASASATVTVSGADTDPTVGDTDGSGLLEQCGVELPDSECPSTHEAVCGCDSCNLQWFVPDPAAVEAIIAECVCLCEAAGCGMSASGGADAGSFDDGCDTGDDETSDTVSDTSSSATSSDTNAE